MIKKRQKLIREFWDRSKYLTINNKKYKDYIEKLINEKLKEDFANKDITTNSLVGKDKEIKANVVAKQNGIIAGIKEISSFLEKNNINIKKIKNEGDKVKNNEIITEIYGNARKILSYERTLLNILQRMSGIATATYNLNKKIKNNCFIAGTRKTLFGLMDKKALSIGGGLTHRLNLNDFILIKDNHLKILNTNFEKALLLASKNKFREAKFKYFEIEVKSEKEALESVRAITNLKNKRFFAIMFDNMAPIEIKNTITKINNKLKFFQRKNFKNTILFEASGNINKKNILYYSETGVDIISLGYLTHSARAFDMSLEIK